MTAYRVVRHDLTSIQWEHIEPLPQVFSSYVAANVFCISLQMGALDCRVVYTVEEVEEIPPENGVVTNGLRD
jgi:hypothetical protein